MWQHPVTERSSRRHAGCLMPCRGLRERRHGHRIAGCSVAYQLAKLGRRDRAVGEQGPLFESGGPASHVPDPAFQVNPSRAVTGLARYSAGFCRG